MSTRRRLERILDLLNRLDAAVVVRDPGNARSAEVFEGLRRTIIQSGKSHRAHVAHLLALQESLWRGATLELIMNRVSDFLRELGIERIENPVTDEYFEIVGVSGDDFEVIDPAIVERLSDGSMSVIQLGKVKRITTSPQSPIGGQALTLPQDAAALTKDSRMESGATDVSAVATEAQRPEVQS